MGITTTAKYEVDSDYVVENAFQPALSLEFKRVTRKKSEVIIVKKCFAEEQRRLATHYVAKARREGSGSNLVVLIEGNKFVKPGTKEKTWLIGNINKGRFFPHGTLSQSHFWPEEATLDKAIARMADLIAFYELQRAARQIKIETAEAKNVLVKGSVGAKRVLARYATELCQTLNIPEPIAA